jgi:hypothetical protein
MDRTLALDKSDHLRDRVFWWNRDHHVNVIQHEMAFFDSAFLLQGELATAKDAAVLDEKIREVTQKLETAPAVRAANPQAEVIARLLHVAREDAEAWYALLFALAVETAAMSVLVLAETTTHHHRQAEKSVAPPPVVQRKERGSASEAGRVLDWMRDRAATPMEW